MPLDTSIKKVLVIGSGPIVIGQAAEFDYAGAQACRVLKEAGVNVVFLFGGGLLRKLILRGNRKAGGTRLCRVQRVEKVFSPR